MKPRLRVWDATELTLLGSKNQKSKVESWKSNVESWELNVENWCIVSLPIMARGMHTFFFVNRFSSIHHQFNHLSTLSHLTMHDTWTIIHSINCLSVNFLSVHTAIDEVHHPIVSQQSQSLLYWKVYQNNIWRTRSVRVQLIRDGWIFFYQCTEMTTSTCFWTCTVACVIFLPRYRKTPSLG